SLPPFPVKEVVARIRAEAAAAMRHREQVASMRAQASPAPDRPEEAAPEKAKGRMTVEEVNEKARRVAGRMGESIFLLLSTRAQAREIGCHFSTWTKTEFYEECRRKTQRQLQQAGGRKASGSRPAQALTPQLEATLGEGRPDEVLHQVEAN